ncbi:MAG: PIN domain nuclease [Alteromonadaceae bacterium]|nr:MAG: PIN domain nuclease [Alteromonadaceae bacterium]
MISIDTNVIIRFLTHDDERQYKKAFTLFSSHEIFIPDTVILETEWVLRYAYEFSPDQICTAFRNLLGLKNVHITNPTLIAQAVNWHEEGMDFADALHLSLSQKCSAFYTFDKKFISKSKGLTECAVTLP